MEQRLWTGRLVLTAQDFRHCPLQAAGVDVRLDVPRSDLSARVSTVLATASRDGVTNLLRHSKAKQCSITIRQTDERVTLELVNDDVPSDSDALTVSACGGLDNLAVRTAEVGGTVTVEHEPKMFRLRVDIPLPDQEMR